MYYTVTVGYESEQLDREGNPRITKSSVVVAAQSNVEANITATKFLAEDMRSSHIIDVKKLKIDCVIDLCGYPSLLKTRIYVMRKQCPCVFKQFWIVVHVSQAAILDVE